MTATAPLSRRLAYPKRRGRGGRLLVLPLVAGMGHFPLPRWEGGHQPWEHPSTGTPRPWGPELPPRVVARKGLCQPLQAPPNHPSHAGAPRLCPTSSTLNPSPAPCCPCGPQQPQGRAPGKEPSQTCNPPFPHGPATLGQLCGTCGLQHRGSPQAGSSPEDRNPSKLLFPPLLQL